MSTRARCFAFTLLLAMCVGAHAEDTALVELNTLLVPLRSDSAGGTNDAQGFWTRNSSGDYLRFVPLVLTPAKRKLRDWIEAALANSPENVRVGALRSRLNADLRLADLFCQRTSRDNSPDRCSFEHADWNSMGFVHPEIEIDRLARDLLSVRAGLGIECGTDTSAYVYQWRNGAWQRLWQDELPIQEGRPYWPRTIDSVLVSPADRNTGERLVLSLGNMDWCSSTFYPIYARLWRVRADGSEPKLLLDLDEDAHLLMEPPVTGFANLADAQIAFMRPGIDIDGAHLTFLHFEVRGDALLRTDPLAENPEGFIEEWLHMPREESRRWVAKQAGDLMAWHARFRSEDFRTADVETRQCRSDTASWQVSMPITSSETKIGTIHFLVAWHPPNRFEMLGISDTPRGDCNVFEPAGHEFVRERLRWR
jgi:hypothetical protein